MESVDPAKWNYKKCNYPIVTEMWMTNTDHHTSAVRGSLNNNNITTILATPTVLNSSRTRTLFFFGFFRFMPNEKDIINHLRKTGSATDS
jgi:hypothetical protein